MEQNTIAATSADSAPEHTDLSPSQGAESAEGGQASVFQLEMVWMLKALLEESKMEKDEMRKERDESRKEKAELRKQNDEMNRRLIDLQETVNRLMEQLERRYTTFTSDTTDISSDRSSDRDDCLNLISSGLDTSTEEIDQTIANKTQECRKAFYSKLKQNYIHEQGVDCRHDEWLDTSCAQSHYGGFPHYPRHYLPTRSTTALIERTMAEDAVPPSVSKFNKFKQKFEEESATENKRKSDAGLRLPNGTTFSPNALKPKSLSPDRSPLESEETPDKIDSNNNKPPAIKEKPKVPGKLNINPLFKGEINDKISKPKPSPLAKPTIEAKPDVAKKPAISLKPGQDSEIKTDSTDGKFRTVSPNKSPVSNRIAEEISNRKEKGLHLKPVSQENDRDTEANSPSSHAKPLPSMKPISKINERTNFKEKLKSPEPHKDPVIKPVSKEPVLVTRSHDNKQFKKLKLLNKFAYGKAPEKPGKLLNIDINSIINKKKDQSDLNGDNDDWGTDEIYDAVEDIRESSRKSSSCRPVSEIKPMSEEEEYQQDIYDDALSAVAAARENTITEEPDEVYDDCETANPDDEFGEIYEEMDELIIPRVDAPVEEQETEEQKVKKDEKEKKKKEKEEKEREKEKKKEEKKREEEKKKKEDEEKRVKKLFKLTGNEEAVAKGTVKEDAKGSNKDLAVKAGQKVSVMRMIDNPAGKFLCQNEEGKWGYVESRNFTIDGDTLKQVTENELIKAQNKASTSQSNTDSQDVENQEIYDDCLFNDEDDQTT